MKVLNTSDPDKLVIVKDANMSIGLTLILAAIAWAVIIPLLIKEQYGWVMALAAGALGMLPFVFGFLSFRETRITFDGPQRCVFIANSIAPTRPSWSVPYDEIETVLLFRSEHVSEDLLQPHLNTTTGFIPLTTNLIPALETQAVAETIIEHLERFGAPLTVTGPQSFQTVKQRPRDKKRPSETQ